MAKLCVNAICSAVYTSTSSLCNQFAMVLTTCLGIAAIPLNFLGLWISMMFLWGANGSAWSAVSLSKQRVRFI